MKQNITKPLFVDLAILILLSGLLGCNTKVKEQSKNDLISEWIGKTIILPKTRTCSVLGNYAPCTFETPKPFKILLYSDSSGCTSCKLRLDEWKSLIKDADTTLVNKIDFVFYFYPKGNDDILDIMKRENFKDQVYIDSNDELNRLNHFPKNMDYQCFLLDKDYKVLSVGNPVTYNKIWQLDKKIIKGEIKD